MSNVLLTGCGAGPSASTLAAGEYYSLTQQATPPLPSDPSWVSTTKFDDVGLNDHTTYESKTDPSTAVYVHGMVVLEFATFDLATYTCSIYAGSPGGSKAYSSGDGSSWTEWDDPFNPPPAAGPHAWTDLSRNPANAVDQKYFAFTAYDAGFDGTWEVRIGDLRVTTL